MLVYITLGTIWESRKIRFGHETGIIVFIGVCIGWLIQILYPTETIDYELNEGALFRILLPLILFSEGYNLHRKEFFNHKFSIVIYGVAIVIFGFYLNTLLMWGGVEIFSKYYADRWYPNGCLSPKVIGEDFESVLCIPTQKYTKDKTGV